ncbi:MAG: SU10 major capsid protein [Mangrovicoccus sp.]
MPLTAADLNSDGLIREDVMDKIWDASNVPLPFTNLVGEGKVTNTYASWTTDALAEPDGDTWVVEGSDSDQDDSRKGQRIGNHVGIKTKEVRVTDTAQASKTIGRGNELAYQVSRRQKELRRDNEAGLLGIQGSQDGDPETETPGIPAGLAAMGTSYDIGSGGSGGVFASQIYSPWTPGTGEIITEKAVRDVAQAAYEDGHMPGYLMTVPNLVRKISEYMFSSSANIATLTRDKGEKGAAQAQGAVNVFLTDFNVALEFVPNRIQRTYQSSDAKAVASVFVFDPAPIEIAYLQRYQTAPLAKTGLSDKRLMSVQSMLRVFDPLAVRVIPDIDISSEMELQ